MPNYCAHVFFGEKVLEKLPKEVRAAVSGNSKVFRSGLFGPDPVTFSLGCRRKAMELHTRWKEDTRDVLSTMLRWGSTEERSYAAGYFCHMMLDDVCHAQIRRLQQEEGLSHLSLEVGLDWLVLRMQGKNRFPNLKAANGWVLSRLAAELIRPARPWQCFAGLQVMRLICLQMKLIGPLYIKKIKKDYGMPVKELYRLLNQTAVTAAENLASHFSEKIHSPESVSAASF